MLENNQELEKQALQLLINFMENPFQFSSKPEEDMSKLEQTTDIWLEKLSEMMDENQIQDLAYHHFLLFEHDSLWKRYLLKVMNRPNSKELQRILQKWQMPKIIVSEVTEVTPEYTEICDEYSRVVYQLSPDDIDYLQGREWLFGIAIPMPISHENELRLLMVEVLNHLAGPQLLRVIEKLLREHESKDAELLFKHYAVDVYEQFYLALENLMVEEIEGAYQTSSLSPREEEVLAALQRQPFYREEKKLLLLEGLALAYFQLYTPDFRKPEVVAAAVVITLKDLGIFGDDFYTTAAIANSFGVSQSSTKVHEERLELLFDGFIEGMEEGFLKNKK